MLGFTAGKVVGNGSAVLGLVVVVDFDGGVFDVGDLVSGVQQDRHARLPLAADLVEVEHDDVALHFVALHALTTISLSTPQTIVNQLNLF